MGYDDRVYGGSGPPQDDDRRRVTPRTVLSWAVVGVILLQIVVILVNWASAALGHPLDIPSVITRDHADVAVRALLSLIGASSW